MQIEYEDRRRGGILMEGFRVRVRRNSMPQLVMFSCRVVTMAVGLLFRVWTGFVPCHTPPWCVLHWRSYQIAFSLCRTLVPFTLYYCMCA